MDAIYADYSISMSEFKKNPAQVLRTAGEKPVAVLNHNRPAFYMITPKLFEALVEEGVVSARDLNLFRFVETAEEAWKIIQDFYANTNDLTLKNLTLEASLPDSLFSFTPPPGVAVHDNTGADGRSLSK